VLALAACSSVRTGLATINGHSLSYSCGGTGPPVVFLAGLGGDHSLWPIAERVRSRAYACTYDRYGDGASTRRTDDTTVTDDASDLHQLLKSGMVPLDASPERRGPVILVGHSYGGLLAYVAARRNRDDVAGLVLIDASHPNQEKRFRSLMTDAQQAIYDEPIPDGPHTDFLASLDEAAEDYGPLGDLPLTVLTATNGFSGEGCDEGLPCTQMQAGWLELQDEYAALSTNSRHVEVDAGHYIHDEKPDLVVDEILSLLERLPGATAAERTGTRQYRRPR
jgi:pimeloyl-ACP methyl ester carboxylesterase